MQRIMFSATATLLLAVTGNAQAQSDRLEAGRQAFNKHCSECHENPASGAPEAGKQTDWENRSELWEAVLLEHAKKGYLEMPARGGSEDASDYEVGAAAEYMLTITHPEMPHD